MNCSKVGENITVQELTEIRDRGEFVNLVTLEVTKEPPVYKPMNTKKFNFLFVEQLVKFYLDGGLYLKKYYEMFGFRSSEQMRSTLKRMFSHLHEFPDAKKVKEMYSKEIQQTTTEHFIQKYGVSNPSKSKEIQDKKSKSRKPPKKIKKPKVELLGVGETKVNGDRLGAFFDDTPVESLKQFMKFDSFIRSLGLLHKPISLDGFEFSYFFEDANVIVELTKLEENTSYFVDRFYFVKMHETASKRGIKLLRFLDCEYFDRSEIIQSMVKHALNLTERKIPARKCELREISIGEAREFFEKSHLNGNASAKVRYGLFYQGELVHSMTFSPHRYQSKQKSESSTNETFELIRCASKPNVLVQGGFQKILSHFKKTHPGVSVESYVDLNISDGNAYRKAGTFVRKIDGDLGYVIFGKKYLRNRLMKIFLNRYFPDFPKRDDPEYKKINSIRFLERRGIYEYHGAGNLVFTL